MQPGDVIATGTPAGVGIGSTPPMFLKPGDTVTISVSGLGTLANTVSTKSSFTTGVRHLTAPVGKGFQRLVSSGKLVYIEQHGNIESREVVIFIHGLGGSTNFYRPAITAAIAHPSVCDSTQILLYDLEGHGLSPTTPESVVSVASYTADLRDLIETLGLAEATISFVAHSMGCLIALSYCAQFKEFSNGAHVLSMHLISPAPAQHPQREMEQLYRRAEIVREQGMLSILDSLVMEAISHNASSHKALSNGYIRTILASTDPEGYAKGCTAWAAAQMDTVFNTIVGYKDLNITVLVGKEDCVTPWESAQEISKPLPGADSVVFDDLGHWCVVEDVEAFAVYFRKITTTSWLHDTEDRDSCKTTRY